MPRIKKEQIAYVATVPFGPPFIFQQGQQLVGADANLTQQIVERVGRVLIGPGSPINVQAHWITRSYPTLVPALENREADIVVAVLGVTENLEAQVLFSEPYYRSELVLVINPLVKDVRPDTADGTTIGVRQATANQELVSAKYPNSTIVPFTTLDDAVLALRRGEVEAVVDDRYMAAFALDTVPGAGNLEILPGSVGTVECAVAVHASEVELLEVINQVIRDVEREGLYEQWIRESLGDRFETVQARHQARLQRERMASEPRRVVIRVSRDDGSRFDIYRMANLNFVLRNTSTGQTHTTSRINFQGRVGVSEVSVPPGSYALSLPRFKFNPGSFTITERDAAQLNVAIRLRADDSVAFSVN